MGLADDREMLEACQADAAQLERDLAAARRLAAGERTERERLQRAVDRLRDLCDEWDEADLAGFSNEVRAIIGRAADSEHDHGVSAHDQPA